MAIVNINDPLRDKLLEASKTTEAGKLLNLNAASDNERQRDQMGRLVA